MRNTEYSVELSELTKRFRDVIAVDDVNLSIRQGELLTLLGPSGCGKTTTLRMIAGFETPSDGEVSISGRSVTNIPSYNRDTGMVFQQYALFPHMTVADNIAFGLEMKGIPDNEIEERVRDALSLVHLEELGDRYPNELSGGQQQRVALTRALAIEPSVLLLDEPLSNLDKQLREDMRLEILRLHREIDTTMVYVTHNQEEALTMSDRMVVMKDGHIRQIGVPEEVYQEPSDKFVADFIGNANLLTGSINKVNEETYTITLNNGYVVELASVTAHTVTLTAGNTITLLFRPNRLTVHSGDYNGDEPNQLHGTIEEATYLGSSMEYFIDIEDEQLHVAQQNFENRGAFESGDEVVLSFEPDAPYAIPGGAV
jgi:spermidine/putrescine ABC transporter ATP-binding subunit